MLLDETEDATEVFCEHHEDVLIKHVDGMFSGLQIKTRASDQDVWRTNDRQVRGSCVRFVKLEDNFPGRFRMYRFLTNHPLYAAQNGKNLRYVLQTIRATNSARDLSGTVADFLSSIASKAGCTVDVAFTALSKTDASDDLPKLNDVEVRLVNTLIMVWKNAADCSYASVLRAARSLVVECGRASSLAHQDVLPAYLPVTANPEEAELASRLAGKRISQSRIIEILDHGLNETAPLESDPEACTEPGAGNKDLLLKKIDAGGFSAVSRNSALDLWDKADYLGIAWTKKHGREMGLQRYGHVQSLVLSDAARAFEATKNSKHHFGLEMLAELRSRFQQRRTEGSQFYECSNEHLEGFAYSLTAQCKVQWSNDRPWEAE